LGNAAEISAAVGDLIARSDTIPK